MRAEAEGDHGDLREVGDDHIWFDERTDKPFPWHKKAYKKAEKTARDAEEEAQEHSSESGAGGIACQ